MKRNDAFHSARLKAEDIKGHRVTVELERIEMEEVGDGQKPVAYFVGKDKSLVLNVTNWNRLEDFLQSDESDDWIGCRIVLSTERVDFQGKRVDAVRVIDGEAPKKPGTTTDEDDAPF